MSSPPSPSALSLPPNASIVSAPFVPERESSPPVPVIKGIKSLRLWIDLYVRAHAVAAGSCCSCSRRHHCVPVHDLHIQVGTRASDRGRIIHTPEGVAWRRMTPKADVHPFSAAKQTPDATRSSPPEGGHRRSQSRRISAGQLRGDKKVSLARSPRAPPPRACALRWVEAALRQAAGDRRSEIAPPGSA